MNEEGHTGLPLGHPGYKEFHTSTGYLCEWGFLVQPALARSASHYSIQGPEVYSTEIGLQIDQRDLAI